MAHDDRILSQAEIDSLLKRILPSPDKPVASEQASPVKSAAPSQPKETVPPGPATAPVKLNDLSKPKEAAPKVAPAAQVKTTEPSKPKETIDKSPLARPVTVAHQETASVDISTLQKNIADLSREVSKLTAAMQTITQLEEKVKQFEAVIKLMPGANRALKGRIDEIASIVETIQQGKSDLAFLEGFTCNHCHVKSTVAIHIKCTSCGKDNWMGWWPDENSK